MIAIFKGSFTIDGITFAPGEHVLNKEQSEHWYIHALISDGLVTVIQHDIEAEVVEEVVTEIKPRKKRG